MPCARPTGQPRDNLCGVTDWRPDEYLIPAIMAGNAISMADLKAPDRCWAVAGLRRAGLSIEDMRDRLKCSLRTVKTVIADPMTDACALLQAESEHFTRELAMATAEIRRLDMEAGEAEAERDRYRLQLGRLLDVAMTEGQIRTFPCGCPRTRYNTYIAPKTGKAGCRAHRTLAVQRYRAKRNGADSVTGTGAG